MLPCSQADHPTAAMIPCGYINQPTAAMLSLIQADHPTAAAMLLCSHDVSESNNGNNDNKICSMSWKREKHK